MDPTVAIPLHFTLEFVGLVAFGGLAAWAVQRRWTLPAVGALALVVTQALHAGQFGVFGAETSPWLLVPRLVGLLCVGVGLLIGGADRQARGTLPVVAVAPVATSVATGAAAAAIAGAARRLPDPRLWAGSWALLGISEVWVGVVERGGDALLDGGPGGHLVRVAGSIALVVWVWRQTAHSLRLRMVSAFGLVLAIVVLAAAGAVGRVAAADRRDAVLESLSGQTAAQVRAFRGEDSALLRNAGLLSPVFGELLAAGDRRVLTDRLSEVVDVGVVDADVAAVVLPGGEVAASAGSDPGDVLQTVAASRATTRALGEGASLPFHSVEVVAAGVASVVVAPVYAPEAPRATHPPSAALAFAKLLDTARLAALGTERGVWAALADTTDGTMLAAGDPQGRALVLPPEAATSLRASDRPWQGNVDGYLVSASPRAPGSGVALVFAAPATEAHEAARAVSQALFAAVLAAALLSVVIALWLGSRIVRPVVRLTETARRVEAGELDARPDAFGQDEIGSLAHAFASMTDSLQQTLGRTEAIVAGMGEGLVAVDPDYRIVTFNEAAERIVGVPASEALGRACYDVYGHSTDTGDGRPICDVICPLRHEGGRQAKVELATDGHRASLAVTCSTLRDADGNLVGGVDLLRDVTAERQAEQLRTTVLRNVSHHVRTPLTSIRGYADLIRKGRASDEQVQEALAVIDQKTRELERLARRVVEVADIEAGRLLVNPQPIPARELVVDAVSRFPDHSIRTSAPKALPHVMADRARAAAALEELVDNAVKFSPGGGRVVVAARAVGGGVEFSVADKGEGIPQDKMDTIAESFVQADSSDARRFEGLGLGLTIVRNVVESHHSNLQIESVPGKGSTFSFRLPAARKRQKAAKSTLRGR